MALTIYSTTWCGPCKRLKSQLTREGIAYEEVDIERDPGAAEFVESVNQGNRTVPTVVVDSPNGRQVRTNPSVAEVRAMLAGTTAPQPLR
ncbi:NrdH-redoxin [Microtetraspora sp. NBRC 13810]|uniref:mycoredoxin n=1 Tax=Microtetraspora sp. NBRC 13810 TaxID=3030990 RepID=UPI0024A5A35D|nr:mycoredoxin [Microtetraspora sp. NBRC 13810]GLW07589.1 NrdH-redoxin [Microtetraspora sp. NBRC 13810]